jgi:hypothetical protein
MSDIVKVMYVGPHVDGVDIEVPMSDLVIHAPKGEPVDVAHDIAYGYELPELDDHGAVVKNERGNPIMRRVRGGLLDASVAGEADAAFVLVQHEGRRSKKHDDDTAETNGE